MNTETTDNNKAIKVKLTKRAYKLESELRYYERRYSNFKLGFIISLPVLVIGILADLIFQQGGCTGWIILIGGVTALLCWQGMKGAGKDIRATENDIAEVKGELSGVD